MLRERDVAPCMMKWWNYQEEGNSLLLKPHAGLGKGGSKKGRWRTAIFGCLK